MKTTNEILEMVEQYKEAAQLIEMAQAEQEKLKSEIKAALAERNATYLEVGCQVVSGCPTTARHDLTARQSRQLLPTCMSSTARPLPDSV